MIALGLPVGFGLALLLIWFVFRKGGYKRLPLDAPPGPDWRFTGERFLDPPSGETVEVWVLPENWRTRLCPSAGELGRFAFRWSRFGGLPGGGPDAHPVDAFGFSWPVAFSLRKPR